MLYHTIGNHDHSMYYMGDYDTVKEYKELIGPTLLFLQHRQGPLCGPGRRGGQPREQQEGCPFQVGHPFRPQGAFRSEQLVFISFAQSGICGLCQIFFTSIRP